MLNSKLVQIHRVLLIAYVAIWLIITLFTLSEKHEDALHPSILFTAIFALPIAGHLFAMIGASRGSEWGRTLSKVMGVLLLLIIPLGAIPGIYMLKQTGKAWQPAQSAPQSIIPARARKVP